MPSNSKNAKIKNKRFRNKSNKRFGGTTPNKLYSPVFPRETKTILKYSDLRSFTTTVTIANDRLYRLNSVFDPDYTGAGHQPEGHDQWAAFYNRYRVDACNVKFTTSYSSADSLICSLVGNNSTTAFTVMNDALEAPMQVSKHYSKGGPAIVVSRRFNLADLNGVTREVYEADDRYSSPMGSDPTENLILHATVFDPAGNAVVVNYSVELEYYVTLFDPIQLPVS